MFCSATARQSELAQRRFEAHVGQWESSANQWFDGTVASVDERIARLDNIIAFTRDTVARLGSTSAGFSCVAALPQLEHTRRTLTSGRESMLKGFSDRRVSDVPAGRRTASRHMAAAIADPVLSRAIELGGREFLAAQNTDDRDELIIRARRYAAEETSTLSVPVSRALVTAFVGKVAELIVKRPRSRQAARQITAYEDFDDALMY